MVHPSTQTRTPAIEVQLVQSCTTHWLQQIMGHVPRSRAILKPQTMLSPNPQTESWRGLRTLLKHSGSQGLCLASLGSLTGPAHRKTLGHVGPCWSNVGSLRDHMRPFEAILNECCLMPLWSQLWCHFKKKSLGAQVAIGPLPS